MSAYADFYRDRDALVTGHTGFKGAWLCLWLAGLGARVHGYSKAVPTTPSLFELAKVEELLGHTVGDVRDLGAFKALLHRVRPSVVFHLAAQPIVSQSYIDPIETIGSNVMGTTVVLEALRSVDWPCVAVMITSDKSYENVEWVWGYRENDRLGGKDIYSASKGAAEILIRSYVKSFFGSHPVRIGVGRAGNVIGGGDWAQDRIVADCVRAWSANSRVAIRCPDATRPWQHVLEPLSGYLALGRALAKDAALHGEPFNFGPRPEQNRTVIELLTDLAREWGFAAPDEAYDVIDRVPFNEASQLRLNCDKAQSVIAWRPSLAYEECVTLTGAWYGQVLRKRRDARELTLEQIRYYEAAAAAQNIPWSVAR